MTFAEICILAACLLPIVCSGISKSGGVGKSRREGGFDNHNPRQWQANLGGWQARAQAAQLNSFEALPIFIAGVLVAQHHNADQFYVNAFAAAFIVLRIGYISMYLMDRASLRSILWALSLLCCIALFFV